ncbi:hypothetical protein QEJ31_15605 [Pigmentibacter sp. JX0631]|uniref:hypothetical protein n=1 Tax=Pigmentibacter sp. JX0631 TaxID=2976982 RepID=UPI00246845F9|nr:hypothetical protein [Pigmentibacter sp. JX0631]WGL59958.1 hypothetical protein QEJ31_15605 [Pigmentibacter sp. JX0631]
MFKIARVVGLIVLSASISGCVIGFSNKKNHISDEFTNVYIPAAIDKSSYSGNASRLTQAIRQKLALNSDLNITSAEYARWAIEIIIADRIQDIVSIDDCRNPANTTVASGAFKCAAIHPEIADSNTSLPKSFSHSTKSPAQEKISLVVETKAIDLNDGKVIWSKRYSARNITPVTFNEIGDIDGNTIKYMQWTPDLHVLRYQESIDNSVKSYSESISADIYNLLTSALPKKKTIDRSKGT